MPISLELLFPYLVVFRVLTHYGTSLTSLEESFYFAILELILYLQHPVFYSIFNQRDIPCLRGFWLPLLDV